MWIPDAFAWTDRDAMRAFIGVNGFGLLISQGPDGPVASHLPMALDGDVLIGHVGRPNPHSRLFDGKTPSLAIFQGAHGYISPRWYGDRNNVPTWNYEAVHLAGSLHAVTDEARVIDILSRLSAPYEAGASEPWTLDDVAPAKLSGLMRGIVAFEMPIAEWRGKRKLSQNKAAEYRAGAIAGLEGSDFPGDAALAAAMRDAGKE